MKYKLINLKTKESILCDKVTIDGYEYYVTDRKPKSGQFYIDDTNQIRQSITDDEDYWSRRIGYKKVIATTNQNIDIPKVVNEVERFAKEYCEYWEFNKILGIGSNGLVYDSFVSGYNKAKETHPFSEEDMVEFAEWVDNMGYTQVANGLYKSLSDEKGKLAKELLEIWKEQQPITLYYE